MHSKTKEKIVLIMKNRGISKYKMSKDTGVSKSSLGEFFSGKTANSKHEATILEYLGIEAEEKIVIL